MKFTVGQEVQLANNPSKRGMIKRLDIEHSGIQYYLVFWTQDEITTHSEDELSILSETNDPKENLINLRLAGYEEFQKLLTFKRLDKEVPLRNNIYAYNASKIKFYPYQFKPLIKFLDSPKNRILICDEVGLGKTIEAGMILTELRARYDMQKVLVICPANLTVKWRLELRKRFGEEFEIVRKKRFQEHLDEIQKYSDLSFNLIISIESIRNEEIITHLNDYMPDIDLVIIDEAHKLRNRGTNQWNMGKAVSNLAQSMIMLTATPIHLGIENLFNLLNILDDDDFNEFYTANERFEENIPIVKAQLCLSQFPPDYKEALRYLNEVEYNSYISQNPMYPIVLNKLKDLREERSKDNEMEQLIDLQRDLSDLNLISHIYTRTRKREVHTDVAIRKAIAHKVVFTPEEKRFYDSVTNHLLNSINITNKGFANWILNMPQRRMSSSIPVMIDYYRNYTDIHPDLPESLSEMVDIEKGISDYQDLQEVISEWDDNFIDSKFNKFIEIINKEKREVGNVKIIVFAFFKGTLRYLERKLDKEKIKCLRIDGDVDIDTRLKHIDSFKNDEKIEILLSSIVGGEGLDFQFCNTIFNYDLPWNPMEMEQRIGRIDRIGQKAKRIYIHNLFIEGSIEERILKRLYSRIEIFKHSIGDLEPIIGDIISDLNRIVFSGKYTKEEEEKLIHEWELAAKRRILEFQKIEQNSAQFIGTDKFFEIEIDNIKKQRRYVTGEQLRIFILDFFDNHCPQTRIEYDYKSNLGYIYPDIKLKWIIKQAQRSSELYKFVSKSNKKIQITFDSNIAFENPEIDFINILHPLVKIIIAKYKLKQNLFPNANHLFLKTDLLKPGFYVYLITRLNIEGAKKISTLENVIIDMEFNEVASRFKAEEILGEMIELGEDPPEKIDAKTEWLTKAYLTCQQIFLDRAENLLNENIRKNENFVNIRLRSLELSYNKARNWLEDQISRTDKEFRINMLTAQLDKKTNIFEEKKLDLDNKREIRKSYEVISSGILEVV